MQTSGCSVACVWHARCMYEKTHVLVQGPVAALEGAKGFSLNVVKRVLFGMLFTTVIVGTIAGSLASFGAYAPSARA